MPFCQTWEKSSPTVQNFSKVFRKSSGFQDFLWEMFLCKCSSGHVESSFDKPSKHFSVKIHAFLLKSKRDEKPIVQEFFFLCTFRLLFRHTGLFFCQNQKKLTRSCEKDDISINYFYQFFSKFCCGQVNCTFQNSDNFFFAKRRILSLRHRKRSNNYSLLFSRKKNQNVPLNPPVACSFNKFEKKFTPKVK